MSWSDCLYLRVPFAETVALVEGLMDVPESRLRAKYLGDGFLGWTPVADAVARLEDAVRGIGVALGRKKWSEKYAAYRPQQNAVVEKPAATIADFDVDRVMTQFLGR